MTENTKERSKTMLGFFGFLMFLYGAGAMDDNRMVLAGIIALMGLRLIFISARKEKSFTPSRPK